MAEVRTYFFDSYAFYEILAGNESYKPYVDDIAIITTKMNLMELHYGFIGLHGMKHADNVFDDFAQFAVEIDDDAIKEANILKFNMRKKALSYIDCLGYVIARKRGVRFLTGDLHFKDMENVEFVR